MDGIQYFKRGCRLLILGGVTALLLSSPMLEGNGTATAQNGSTPALMLTVTNASEDINGDVSSPAALLASPGADGISLVEALKAVEADIGAHETINFSPTLSGSRIKLTQDLPSSWRDGFTLDGDIDDDGVPDITIDGGGVISHAIRIQAASDVVIEGLHFRNFTRFGIEINIGPQDDVHSMGNLILRHNTFQYISESAIVVSHNQSHSVISDIEIVENTFQNYRYAIKLNAGFSPGASDNEISNVLIRSNTLIAPGFAIGISISPGINDVSQNTIRNIAIRENQISGHANSSILIDAAAKNCTDNLIDGILIAENQIDGTPVTIEVVGVGESGIDAARNRITNITITDNHLTGGGIQFGGATGFHSHDNTISGVLIDRNHITSCAANGIFFMAGSGGSQDNLIENVVMSNTLIGDCRDAGILLHGDDRSSLNNVINNVTIANLTLVKNGVDSRWAGGININTLDASNAIHGVTVSNTILWQNGGGDAILGALAPASVTYSRLDDWRFVDNNGNFNSPPDFVDPTSGDYHLQSDSPCIDSGDPLAVNVGELDLDQNTRLWDANGDGIAVVDRGAYELNIIRAPETSVPTADSETPIEGICASGGIALIAVLWLWWKRR